MVKKIFRMLSEKNKKEIRELISFLRPLELKYEYEASTIQYVIEKVESFITRFDIPQPYKENLEKYIKSGWFPEKEARNNGFLVAENLEEYLKFITKIESKQSGLENLSDKDESKILISVLHFSDLHFGEYSALIDESRKSDFSNLFSNFKHKLNLIIDTYQINLIVISGDISSKNRLIPEEKISKWMKIKKSVKKKQETQPLDSEIPEYLLKFIDIFAFKNIPILLAKGNHDKNRGDNQNSDIFLTVFNKLRDHLNIKLSKDFEKNFISFFIEPNHKLLFFTIDTTFSLSPEGNWKDSNIDIATIDDFFKELKETHLNLKDYSIFLITHHPLAAIPNNKSVLAGLAERNINIVFSGHTHDKYCDPITIPDSTHVIHNYIAGSPTLSKEIRDEEKSWNLKSLQFNYYEVYDHSIQAYYYELDSNDLWRKHSLCHQEFDLSSSITQIEKNKTKKSEKFLKLAKLLDRLFYKRGETASAFVQAIINDEVLRDYFGISIKNPQSTNLANEKVYFLDGDYYIIPNSVTLRRIDVHPEIQLITKNNADDNNIKYKLLLESSFYSLKSSESKILPSKISSILSNTVDFKIIRKKSPTTFLILLSSALFLVINCISG